MSVDNYSSTKGFDESKPPKSDEEKFLTVEQLAKLLETVKATARPSKARRDHAAIYLGFYLALRVGEAAILERSAFRDMDRGIVWIKTLKRRPTTNVMCTACGRKYKTADRRSVCPKCHETNIMPAGTSSAPPEIQLPFLEDQVKDYIRGYLKRLPNPQRYLFESKPGHHISEDHLMQIFGSYVMAAGLPPIYSWHALRHGRGVQLWEKFQNPLLCRDFLRHKSWKTCEIYSHMSPGAKEKARKELEKDAIQFKKAQKG